MNPETLTLSGVTDRQLAWRLAAYRYQQLSLQRDVVTFTCGLDGLIPLLGDVIMVQWPFPAWASCGIVEGSTTGIDSIVLTLSDSIPEDTEWISFRMKNGDVYGPIPCDMKSSSSITIALSCPIRWDNLDQEPIIYAVGASSTFSRAFAITSSQLSDGKVSVEATEYSSDLFAYDTSIVPAIGEDRLSYAGLSCVPWIKVEVDSSSTVRAFFVKPNGYNITTTKYRYIPLANAINLDPNATDSNGDWLPITNYNNQFYIPKSTGILEIAIMGVRGTTVLNTYWRGIVATVDADSTAMVISYIGDAPARPDVGVGTILKATSYWDISSGGVAGTDDYGFRVLPVGCRYAGGKFDPPYLSADFWSASINSANTDCAWGRNFYSAKADMQRMDWPTLYSFEIRCIVNSISFIAIIDSRTGTYTDTRDSTTYPCVLMPDGNWWFAKNLAFVTAASFDYNNDTANRSIYGRLYPWADLANACPANCHIPTDGEWTVIANMVEAAAKAVEIINNASTVSGDRWAVYPVATATACGQQYIRNITSKVTAQLQFRVDAAIAGPTKLTLSMTSPAGNVTLLTKYTDDKGFITFLKAELEAAGLLYYTNLKLAGDQVAYMKTNLIEGYDKPYFLLQTADTNKFNLLLSIHDTPQITNTLTETAVSTGFNPGLNDYWTNLYSLTAIKKYITLIGEITDYPDAKVNWAIANSDQLDTFAPASNGYGAIPLERTHLLTPSRELTVAFMLRNSSSFVLFDLSTSYIKLYTSVVGGGSNWAAGFLDENGGSILPDDPNSCFWCQEHWDDNEKQGWIYVYTCNSNAPGTTNIALTASEKTKLAKAFKVYKLYADTTPVLAPATITATPKSAYGVIGNSGIYVVSAAS